MKRMLKTLSVALGLAVATSALAQQVPITPGTANPLPYVGQTPGAIANLDTPLPAAGQPQFQAALPIPVDYTKGALGSAVGAPATPTFDYYEIQYAQVRPVGPWVPPGVAATAVPDTTQWLGLRCPAKCTLLTCNCVAGAPLYTPVWGYGQVNMGGGPLSALVGSFVDATYPSMNIRASKGTPVKVKWINNLPDQHLFCEDPQNANWPCAIDRTLMGTKVGTGVTAFGGSQQPDNAVVVHLHGGDVPPEADGFAELWFGNANTSSSTLYPLAINPTLSYLNPPTGMASLALQRPAGTSVIYNYPMGKQTGVDLAGKPIVVGQDASMIWFHDHALGKTRINVVAGPAGFFQVNDYGLSGSVEDALAPLLPKSGPPAPWGAGYEINVALQDRSFNWPLATKTLYRWNNGAKGPPIAGTNIATINYPNGLNWLLAAPLPCVVPPVPAGETAWTTKAVGTTVTPNPLTPGVNPCEHPQWVPEYFGDVSIVNGMAWPFQNVEPRRYRVHFLDGSNARCWNIRRSDGLPITVIGDEQGYLNAPVPVTQLTMCPGERYDTILDFTGLAPGTVVNLLNNASAPFPKGVNPTAQDVGRVMQFRVNLPLNTAVPNPVLPATFPLPVGYNASPIPVGQLPCAWNAAQGGAGLHAGVGCTAMRQKVLNEVLDPVSLAPLRVQIDGKAFEAPITETPKLGTVELWKIVNTTVDAHPIHTHLVKHKIISRQKFDTAGFSAASGFAVPGVFPACAPGQLPPGCLNLNVDVTPFLNGGVKLPAAYEAGWKDASISYPGEVLTIVAKWDGNWDTATPDPSKPINGDPLNPTVVTGYGAAFLAPTAGPYVWHCHIVDHEDNEMMRPVVLAP